MKAFLTNPLLLHREVRFARLSFAPSVYLLLCTYPGTGVFGYSAFLVLSTGIGFAYLEPARSAAPWRGLVNICVANWVSFQHKGSKKFRVKSPLWRFRPLTVEKNLSAPQWPMRHQLRFQASTLPLLIVFFHIKKDLHHSLKISHREKGFLWKQREPHTF